MITALAFLNAVLFIVFFPSTATVLLVGEIFCGFAWGVFATIGPAYASEVCPTNLRGYLTIYVNMCWAHRPADCVRCVIPLGEPHRSMGL